MTTCATKAEKPSKAATVQLQIVDWKGVEKLVASQKGKVVVVDIWTTTCSTCVEEFPKLVALQKKYGRDRLACISLACDYDGIKGKPPKYYAKGVLKFLKKQNATFDNVLLTVPFIDFLDQIDLSSTPALLVYGKDGKLVKRFDNDNVNVKKIADEFTFDEVESLVKRLIAQ
jgi:thiol-disulfide isomerase/thioredoxin